MDGGGEEQRLKSGWDSATDHDGKSCVRTESGANGRAASHNSNTQARGKRDSKSVQLIAALPAPLTPPRGGSSTTSSRSRNNASAGGADSFKSKLPLAHALTSSLRALCKKAEARDCAQQATAINSSSNNATAASTQEVAYPPWCDTLDPFSAPHCTAASATAATGSISSNNGRSSSNSNNGSEGDGPSSVGDSTLRLKSADNCDKALLGLICRLLKHSRCSISSYAVALIYLRRIVGLTKYKQAYQQQQQQQAKCLSVPPLRLHNVWRLFLSCTVVAAKYLDDRVHSNEYYALIMDVAHVRELNAMELCILRALDFRLAVSSCEYKLVERELALAALRATQLLAAAAGRSNANAAPSSVEQEHADASSNATTHNTNQSRRSSSRMGHARTVCGDPRQQLAHGALFPPFFKPHAPRVAASNSATTSQAASADGNAPVSICTATTESTARMAVAAATRVDACNSRAVDLK